ncbi:hypothetical protein TH9_05880 [Thalassospira xiamenensis]|nr:hypothetical protein TH9_05880 [Thalassospira xiamenensis]
MRCLLVLKEEFRLRIVNTTLNSDVIQQKCQTMNLSNVSVEVTSGAFIVKTCDPTAATLIRVVFGAEDISD